MRPSSRLTVRLLVAGTSTRTTELLGLASARIGDEQGSVVLNQGLLQLSLGGLIDICYNHKQRQHIEVRTLRTTPMRHEGRVVKLTLLVVSDDTLGDGLSDSIDLRSRSTTLDSNADVNL